MHEKIYLHGDTAVGGNHPQTSRAISNLGVLYEKWGKYEDAERLIKSALENREKNSRCSGSNNHSDLRGARTCSLTLKALRRNRATVPSTLPSR